MCSYLKTKDNCKENVKNFFATTFVVYGRIQRTYSRQFFKFFTDFFSLDTPLNVHNFVSDVNGTRRGLPEAMNGSLATYVLTTALNLEHGKVSHWSFVAAKPGRIKVQVTLQVKYLSLTYRGIIGEFQ